MTIEEPTDFLTKINLRQVVIAITTVSTVLTILLAGFNYFSQIKYDIISMKLEIETTQAELKIVKAESKQAIKGLELSGQSQEIKYTKIETKLENIDRNLLDIKQRLKD